MDFTNNVTCGRKVIKDKGGGGKFFVLKGGKRA